VTPVHPVGINWIGFYPDGREMRVVYLSDGRLITDKHSSFNYWEKKLKPLKVFTE